MSASSFLAFLQKNGATPAVVREAAVLYVGETTQGLPTSAMRSALDQASNDVLAVTKACEQLQGNFQMVDSLLLDFFADEWLDEKKQDAIRRGFAGAKRRMTGIDIAIVGIVTLYAMYLGAFLIHLDHTGGAKKTQTIIRRPDGTLEEINVTEYRLPSTPHDAVGSLLKKLLPVSNDDS